MAQRATAVAQLLDSLRIARLNEEGAATQNMAIPVGSKRSWDASQGIHPPRPLKLIFESGQGPRSVSEPTVPVPHASSPVSSFPCSFFPPYLNDAPRLETSKLTISRPTPGPAKLTRTWNSSNGNAMRLLALPSSLLPQPPRLRSEGLESVSFITAFLNCPADCTLC